MNLKRFSLLKKKESPKKNGASKSTSVRNDVDLIKEDRNEDKTPRFNLAAAATAAAAANSSSSPTRHRIRVDPSCVLFEDDHSQEENDSFNLKPKEQKQQDLPLLPKTFAEQTPKSPILDLPPPGSSFLPPTEVRIDPDSVPPSPMRDPPMDMRTTSPGNLLSNPTSMSTPTHPGEVKPGEPVGDIGMRTQLWDAERLVRVILGKRNDNPLESGSILQAIRSFAVMKQELLLLRKQQEVNDGDPPAILQTLGSPATTATTRNSFAGSNGIRPSTPQRHSIATTKMSTPSPLPSGSAASINKKAIIEAAKKIQSMERELKLANEKIERLEKEKKAQVDSAAADIQKLEETNLETQKKFDRSEAEKKNLVDQVETLTVRCENGEDDYKKLLKEHETSMTMFKSQIHEAMKKVSEVSTAASREPDSVGQVSGEAASEKEEMARLRHELRVVKEKSAQKAATMQAKLETERKERKTEADRIDGERSIDCSMEDDLAASVAVEEGNMREKLRQMQLELQNKDQTISDLQKAQKSLQASVTVVLDSLAAQKIKPKRTSKSRGSQDKSPSATIDGLNQRIASLEAQNAEHHASVSLLQGTLDALQKGGSSPKLVLQELQANTCKRPQRKSQRDEKTSLSGKSSSNRSSSQRLQMIHDEHKAIVANIQVLEEEMKLST